MKARVQLRYGQNKPIMALGQSDRHHVRSYTGQAMTPTKVAREDVMPEIPEKKNSFRYQRPTTRITDFCYWFWELKKVGRVSSLEKNVVEIFFLDLQVTLVNISMRWKNWEINSANSRINTWFVTFFFFGFIICILFQINWINYFARKCIALHDLEIAHLYWYH